LGKPNNYEGKGKRENSQIEILKIGFSENRTGGGVSNDQGSYFLRPSSRGIEACRWKRDLNQGEGKKNARGQFFFKGGP